MNSKHTLMKFISTQGYKKNSPDKDNPFNIIPSGRITMQDVEHPVLGIDNLGNQEMMYPGNEYQFPGDSVFEIPVLQKGGKTPIYVDSKNDPRYKAYQDSLYLYNQNKKQWIYPGSVQTTKQDYINKKNFEQNSFLHSFDHDLYEKDKKNKKVKNFEEYVYRVNDDQSKLSKKDIDAFNRNTGKYYETLKEPIEEKQKDGTIKSYYSKYKGKIDKDTYTIYDPITKTTKDYYKSNLLNLHNVNIKPIESKYYALKNKQKYNSINISSLNEEHTNGKLTFRNSSKKSFDDYTYGATEKDIFAKPTTPVMVDPKKYKPNDPRALDLMRRFNNTFKNGVTPVKDNQHEENNNIYQNRQPLENINISSQGYAQNNIGLTPNLNIVQQARVPQYFNVTDKVNQNFGGVETNYRWYPDQPLPPSISKQTYDDGTPMNTRTMVPVYQKGGNTSQNRNFWDVAVNFIPGYETYLDLKDVVVGAATGNKNQMNQGVIGLGMPISGKALHSALDYTTEKTLGKKQADQNQQKREDILNMTNEFRQKLYLKYGPGGYDKWVKAGKPNLKKGGMFGWINS